VVLVVCELEEENSGRAAFLSRAERRDPLAGQSLRPTNGVRHNFGVNIAARGERG
jgi:hypothetical protein